VLLCCRNAKLFATRLNNFCDTQRYIHLHYTPVGRFHLVNNDDSMLAPGLQATRMQEGPTSLRRASLAALCSKRRHMLPETRLAYRETSASADLQRFHRVLRSQPLQVSGGEMVSSGLCRLVQRRPGEPTRPSLTGSGHRSPSPASGASAAAGRLNMKVQILFSSGCCLQPGGFSYGMKDRGAHVCMRKPTLFRATTETSR
jgi:hypothetical protein